MIRGVRFCSKLLNLGDYIGFVWCGLSGGGGGMGVGFGGLGWMFGVDVWGEGLLVFGPGFWGFLG